MIDGSVPDRREERIGRDDAVFRAACVAMRLLQDRQQHTPQELLDAREIAVLRQLRNAIRRDVSGGRNA